MPPDTPSWLLPTREQAKLFFQTGVNAADPASAVRHCMVTHEERLELATDSAPPDIRSKPWTGVRLVAIGKAALPMARQAVDLLPTGLLIGEPIVVTNYDNVTKVPGLRVLGSGHPLPDQAGLDAAAAVSAYVGAARAGELVLVLLSGGGSALLPRPVAGIALADKIAATELLLSSGADIVEINAVRKHLSQLKGGGLARLAAPADVHTIILSDVIGDDLSSIASGPTVADTSTFAGAIAVFEQRGLWPAVPPAVRTHLRRGRDGEIAETPKPGDSLLRAISHKLAGSNSVSLEALRTSIIAAGYQAHTYTNALTGEARDAAAGLVAFTKEVSQRSTSNRRQVLIAGGETTVTLRGSGRGGRNQELALAFACTAGNQLPQRWVLLSGGTDGRDGPTDAAGGLVDPWTCQRITAAGGDPVGLLDNNDAYHALGLSGDLLMTGATGTNVADLQIVLLG